MEIPDDIINRFLAWRLPADFAPDGGVKFTPSTNQYSWPVGTNLLTHAQAKQMLEHVVGPLLSELEQERDIRTSRECVLSLVADGLKVAHEPHQTFDERLLEASCTPR